jgi:hypothetical protein
MEHPLEDDDFLDACDIDFAAHAVDESEVEMLPLFPEGYDEELDKAWQELFSLNGESE